MPNRPLASSSPAKSTQRAKGPERTSPDTTNGTAIYAYIDTANHPNVSISGIHGVSGFLHLQSERTLAFVPPSPVVRGTGQDDRLPSLFAEALPQGQGEGFMLLLYELQQILPLGGTQQRPARTGLKTTGRLRNT